MRRQIQEKQNKSRRSVERIQNLLAEAKHKFGKPEGQQYGYDEKEGVVKLFPDPLPPRVRAILPLEKYRQIVEDEDESF